MEYPLQPWSLKVYINVYTLVRLHKKSTNTYRYGTIEPTLQKNSFTGLNITVQAYMFVQYRYSIIAVWLDGVLKIDVSYNLLVFLWISSPWSRLDRSENVLVASASHQSAG